MRTDGVCVCVCVRVRVRACEYVCACVQERAKKRTIEFTSIPSLVGTARCSNTQERVYCTCVREAQPMTCENVFSGSHSGRGGSCSSTSGQGQGRRTK